MVASIIVFLLIIIWGAWGIEFVFKKSNKLDNSDIRFLKYLYVFHILVSFFYGYYVLKNGGDATGYWFMGDRFSLDADWSTYYHTGTYFILFLTYPLTKYFHISFYMGGLIFATIGFSGFIYFYIIIRRFVTRPIILYGISVFPFIMYLPNLHFWSVGIGKDALVLFAIMLFYNALFDIKQKWISVLLALVIAYHIRPHIAFFLIASSSLAVIIDGKLKMGIKIVLSTIMIIGGVLLFNTLLSFLKIDEVSADSITQFSETRSENLSKDSGSSVDVKNYPFPLKVFTFLYRPLFFDVHDVMGIISSIENVILLWLSFLMLKLKPFAAFKAAPMPIKSLFIFFGVSSMAFAMILSNLGIMLRQKSSISFCLIIFIIWCMAIDRQKRIKRKERSNKLAAQKLNPTV